MKFKIGDRVKIKSTALCGEKGSVFEVKFSTVWVLLDGTGQKIGLSPSQVIRLVKKKKQPAITRQQLAAAWNRFVWGNNHTYASESILFEAFCKEIGL